MSALSFIAHTKKSWLFAKQITQLTPSNINRVVPITPRKCPCSISSFLSSEAPAIKATFRIACKRRRISSHRFSLVFSYSSVGDTRRPELNTSAFTGYLRRNLGFCNRNPILWPFKGNFWFFARKVSLCHSTMLRYIEYRKWYAHHWKKKCSYGNSIFTDHLYCTKYAPFEFERC